MLPRLIFGERHDDKISGRMLAKLLPRLQAVGYNCFLDEMPASTTLQAMILEFESRRQLFQRLTSFLFINHGVDLLQNIDFNDPFFNSETGKTLKNSIKGFMADLTFLEFYQALQRARVNYESIDLAILKDESDLPGFLVPKPSREIRPGC